VRHVAADRALDVLGLDAEGSLTPRYASQHALHEVIIVLVAVRLEVEIGAVATWVRRRRLAAKQLDL